LLVIEDPLDVFNYNIEDDELELLKDQLCFRLKNDKFMIKPGVVSGFRSLKEALRKKTTRRNKTAKEKAAIHDQHPFVFIIFAHSDDANGSTGPVLVNRAESLSPSIDQKVVF
jgi:hypothetical protein